MVDFIYYSVGDKKAKVTKEAQEEFEKKYPDAKIHLTYNGRNAQVSLNSRDAFLSKYGADNITYSAYDEDKQYSPDLSVNKYFGANPPVDAPEEANVSVSAEVPISKRQQRKAEREAEWLENRAANADMANATIESHQSHKEKIDEYLSSVDKEYKEKQSSEPKKSFWQRLTESMAQAGSERRLGASSHTVDLKKQDIEKGQDYVDAKIAKNISNKIDDKIEEYNDPAKNFVYGVGHGLADTVFDIDTWDSTVGAEEAARVYAITKKLDRGEALTDGEQMIIDALVDDLASDMYMASGFGRGYKAGKVTGESLPFMLETALNPASGFGKQFTKKFGKEVFKQVSKRLGKAAGKAAVYTTRIGADIAGAAMMSATTSQARVAEDALNRLSGDVDFKLNDEGTLDFNGFVGGEDSAFKAYAKAFGANTIEHFSEMVGNYFAPIGQMAKSGTAQLANKIGLKKVSELLTEMTPNGFGSLINDFTERTQWQGVIGEFSEEMVSGALNALIVGDQSLKKYDDNGNINPNYLFEKDNMIDTFLGVAILGGAISAVKTVGYTTPETRYNREISRAKKNLSEYFNEDEISQLEAFASNPMGASYANLTPFFEDSRKKEAKEAAGRYLAAVLNKQGYEIARNADLSGTQQGMNEMRMAAQLGQNMTEADLYDVIEEEAKALRAVEETGLLERLDENDTQYLLHDATSYELFKTSNEHWRTDSEREALKNLALVRNAREGLENSLNNRAQAFVDASNRIATESATDGVLTVGVHDGQIVFIKGGVRVDNGGIVSPDFVSGYPVEIVNSITGEASTVDSSEILHAFNVDVDTYNTNNSNTIKAYFQQKWDKFRNTKSVKSKLAEVEQLIGQTVYIDNGNGNNMAEVEIMQILPNGEVVIKGKKGDLGGQSTLRVDVDSFYDSMTRDANGNPIFDQSKFRSQTENINNAQSRLYNQEQTTTEVTPQEAEVTEEDDFRDTVAPILINGVPIEVEVVSQDNATNRIVYRYTDENGQERTGIASIGEFKTALQQAQEYKPEEPIVPEVPTEAPTAEATTEPTPTDVPTEIEPVAEEINWDALFEQDQEAFFAELQKQFGEETLDILNEFVSAAQEELDSLNKKKRSSNPNDILATRNQKAALQKRIDAYNQMIARLSPAPEAPVVEEPTSETPVETTPIEPTVEPAPTEPVDETPVTETPTDGKSENGFEFNKHNVCTNPEIISVPSVKKGWAVMNELRLAEFNGKWGSAIDAHTGTGGVGIPLTKSDCKFDTKEEAIADAYKALVSYRASRNGDTGLKDLDNLIKHLEKEYPFVKEAATPAPAPQPAPAEPITTENGFVIVDKVITNPEVIEMPNTPKGDANRIFIGEYNGKWTYGAEALMDNGSWGTTPQMRIENAKYDTREEAIKAAISFLENQWRNKRKDAGSAALDAFLDYVRNTYLPNEVPAETTTVEPEPSVVSEPTSAPQPTLEPQSTPQPAPAPKPTAMPKPKPIGQVEQQRGNAINRLFEEFKENAAKIAKKIGMKDFVSTDKLRPAMTGVYREGGYEFASDGNILAKIKTSYPVEQEGKIFSTKTGQEIEGRYPKANEVTDSHRKNAIKVEVNVDDILAYSQTLEEIRKGLNRDKLYVKVGDRIFNAQALLKAAKMAKLHGLSEIYMRGDSRAPIIFVGENGVILAMPYQLDVNDKDILDVSTGKITFNDFSGPKVPTTLKGIEATRVALEAVIPNYDNEWIDVMKSNGWLRLEDGKVFYSFDKGDISSVKYKAKDPNTYNALEAIEKNGLEVPLSDEEIAKIFPESVTDSPVNSVPLEGQPKEGENESERDTQEGELREGYNGGIGSTPSDDEGGKEGASQTEAVRGSETDQSEVTEDKYPVRNGDATPQLLIDTFGFESISPNVGQSNLNTVYDFMMEMSKMLGISPKSIGHGATLGVGILNDNARPAAQYSFRQRLDGTILEPTLRFKNTALSSIAHEWWHSLDQALSYYETGKGVRSATNAITTEFTGRPETLQAVRDVVAAINKSGHKDRLKRELSWDPTFLKYSLRKDEMSARAFEEYLKMKFAEVGIDVQGFSEIKSNTPTAEEMKVIAPAFDNLFRVLQEKEGRNPGSSVLYHIGEMAEQNNEAKNQLGALVADWIQQGGNFVVMDNEAMLNALEESGNARMLETPDGVIYGFVKDGVVYLNPSLLNANTSIHEYTHLWDNALMQLNRPLWEKGKALMKKTALWKEVVNDPNYADIKDNEDLVASEVHSRLVGAEGAKRLEQLEQEAREKGLTKGAKDLSILGRLREWLNEAAQWLKDTFSVWSKEEIDAVSLDDFLNMPLRDLANFTALPQAESGQITNENGDLVANNNGNGHIQFSISTWREGGRDYLANWLANDKTLAEDEKADILARMDEFYENAQKYTDVYVPFGTWSEAAVKYDKDGNPLMSVIKANGDYSMNLDFSLVCKKRRPLNMLLRELINRNAFASYTLRERELAEINWILQEHGFEVACALCFVDAKRFIVTGVADVFATLYNRFVKALAPDGAQIAHFNYSNNPNVEAVENGIDTMSDEQLNWKKFDALAKKYGPKTVEGKVAKFLRENPSQRRLVDATDFIDANGFEAVKEGNPTLLSLYNSKKGTGGPKASFGDVQYLNDILKKEKSFDVEKAYAVGGVRLQSFSDFVPHMYFDYMQLFAELAAKKLPAHAYTKEVLFAKIFGMTGIKINMSLVPSVVEGGVAPGLDANGNYAWADAINDKDGNVIQQAQSFPFDEAMAIQNAEGYSKNCGVIAVGISDAHILKMLNDPNIPFIIPYHKSSLNAIVARMTNIDQYKDYTNVQNTRKADGTKLAKGTPDFNFNAYLRENPEATPQQAAQAYLDWCKEHNYRPKFSQFASHPNYYKLLQDFNTIDAVTGEYTPQGAVTMTFPTEQSEFGNVESLIQQGLQEDAELEEKMSSEISSIADKVIDRLKEIENESKLSEKKYAEQMAKLADERMARIKERAEDDGILSRSGDVTTENKDIRYRRSDIQNAAVDYLAGEPRNRVIENAVNEEATKLGVTVTYKTRSEMPNGHKNDKGYYNTKTGEIVVCTENNASINDAIQTILHEAVAHKGLRQLMGDRFDEFINRVYDALDAETKAKVDELATKHYNGNKAVAMEEYMATLAESENFAETSAWDKIKSIFEKIINSILGRNDIKIGDNELRYILRASYANMVNPRNMETIEGWAKDTNMREEYKVNEATPEILSRTDIDPTVVSTETARAVYDRTVASVSQEFQRQFQDAYQPVRIAIDAIQQETGNQPIEDYENYLLIQNQSSSRSRVEIDDFSRLYYSPIIDQVNMLIDAILESRGFNKNNKAERSRAYKEIRQYLIAKHGLERNAYYQTRNTRLIKAKTKAERVKSVREDHKDIVDKINNDPTLSPAEKRDLIKQEKKRRDVLIKQIRETDYELDVRDYSGLTALFGLRPEQFEEAEDLAKELVENFESNTGDMTEELWKRINKATNKTLKHSYECGLLSRQQYNEIKSMFEFYIPLRGFDEATAEDVYSYARFEGNKFNPAVAKTGGRTSLADDPLALIMNMAESEITQGNKNRAKQALYNFLLNRADGMDTQNSLMQIESVWCIKTIDSFGNELYVIASPDHEAGETLEDFEERMKALEEAGLAKRSKKGNVDVGMRFQKEKNKGSHYIYLKVNGVEKAIYINGDPKAADAVNGVYSEQYGEGLQKIRDIQRAVSSTFTNYSLEFTARNYFRDMVYSHINIGVRESDPAYRKKFRQNWRHNNIKTMLKMLKAYRAGELDNRTLTEDEAAFVEFMRNGGQTGYTLINSVENHKKDLERAIRRMQKGIEKGGIKDSTVFKATLGGIELLNEASELVTRFAAFKTSRDMGRDINTSISDAKEVTVNFNTKGAQDGKGFFGIVARYLGAFKYFFNASVQGVQNLWAMMLSNKIKFGTVVGSTIAFGAMMPLIQGALAALLGDNDDENEYWNIPEYERQNNLCFVLGGGRYAKLPLPIGFREMYGLGDMMAAAIANRKVARDPLAVATDVSNKIASIVLPINPLEGAANGLSLVESGTNMLLPDLTQGLIQNRTNVDFKGDPIQKEYTYNENDPQWTKTFSNNPAWIKGLCKWMNENIVIDGVGLDVSPEKLDNTFSNLLGGVYSLVKKSGRAISMIWNEDNRHISNVPLIGVMVGTGIDEDDRFVNSSYWDMNDYYKSRLPYIKRTAENFGYSLDEVFKRVEEGETRAGAHHPKMSKIYNRDNFDWMQEWYLGHKGEGEIDENGESILGIDQYKNKIKYLEKKIKKNENGEPTPEQAEELAKLNADYNKALEGFVYDMLEFD